MGRRDTNFYYSFVVLPAHKRAAIIAVWDFFRAVDDAVDEAGAIDSAEARAAASAQVGAWRRELAACYGEGTPATPQGKALVAHVSRFGLPRQAFADVIDGVEMDVTRRTWATFGDLRQYCLRVASAVGLVCIEIFGYRNAACRQYAVDLGIALQLTNILRDLGKDLRAGRLYLPQEDLARFGVTEEQLRLGQDGPAVRALLAFQAGRAHEYFERAAAELPRDDARSLVAARIMGAIYQALLHRIEQGGFAVFGAPLRLSRWRKAGVALRLWASSLLGM
jgi:15-cis-phytoene synthase